MNVPSRPQPRAPIAVGAWIMVLAAGATPAHADGYTLTWFTVDHGGGRSEANGYLVRGTVGEPDAGARAGGSYALQGGFWSGSNPGTTGAPDAVPTEPLTFRLRPPSPNPIGSIGSLAFDLASAGPTRVRLFDASGALVRSFVDGPLERGRHELTWQSSDASGRPLASGVYFLCLEQSDKHATRKVVIAH